MTAGIAVDLDDQRPGIVFDKGARALPKGIAGGFGIGVLQNDFVKDVNVLAHTLQQKHGHGVDVEIDAPDQGMVDFETHGIDVLVTIEGVIGAI